jgi:hypothetical protein
MQSRQSSFMADQRIMLGWLTSRRTWAVAAPGAPVGQFAVAVEVVVGDRLGHRDVAVQQHPQLVAHLQVDRVEGLDVEPQGVEPGRLGRRDLLADAWSARPRHGPGTNTFCGRP